MGIHSFLNNELLKDEILMLFSCSDRNLLHCDFQTIQQYWDQHGMEQKSWMYHEMRSLIAFHLVMGMCTFGNGEVCKVIVTKHDKSQLMQILLKLSD